MWKNQHCLLWESAQHTDYVNYRLNKGLHTSTLHNYKHWNHSSLSQIEKKTEGNFPILFSSSISLGKRKLIEFRKTLFIRVILSFRLTTKLAHKKQLFASWHSILFIHSIRKKKGRKNFSISLKKSIFHHVFVETFFRKQLQNSFTPKFSIYEKIFFSQFNW